MRVLLIYPPRVIWHSVLSSLPKCCLILFLFVFKKKQLFGSTQTISVYGMCEITLTDLSSKLWVNDPCVGQSQRRFWNVESGQQTRFNTGDLHFFFFFQLLMKLESQCVATCLVCARLWCVREQTCMTCTHKKAISCLTLHIKKRCQYLIKSQSLKLHVLNVGCRFFHWISRSCTTVRLCGVCQRCNKLCQPLCSGALDEDVVVIESTPAPAPPVPASEEINVTSTDSEVEIVTVGDGFRWAPDVWGAEILGWRCRCRAVTYRSSPVSLLSCLSSDQKLKPGSTWLPDVLTIIAAVPHGVLLEIRGALIDRPVPGDQWSAGYFNRGRSEGPIRHCKAGHLKASFHVLPLFFPLSFFLLVFIFKAIHFAALLVSGV